MTAQLDRDAAAPAAGLLSLLITVPLAAALLGGAVIASPIYLLVAAVARHLRRTR
ncbi:MULTISPECIES: hypothetical protein [Catenuloplanes]|uniref:Uncharacterized protein n=1 Tax=Catenuloplanes niger TaxID=587534 RepID=A0AAE3ZT46_9ACTN|nr:hypothetical protein [Catenuloplanes niger]MDR7323400.1 hypothetical protein [Catenuloplanes niger]